MPAPALVKPPAPLITPLKAEAPVVAVVVNVLRKPPLSTLRPKLRAPVLFKAMAAAAP